MIARLVRSADFERVLRTRSRSSSAHFALHHLADRPGVAFKPAPKPADGELSTALLEAAARPVDDFPSQAPDAVWLGFVVPKRHARRSVTRTLVKRQIRAVAAGHAASLAKGLWVVRLRAPFDRARFTSAASEALKRAVREELDGLIGQAARRASAA